MGLNLLRLRCKTPTSLLTTLSGWLLSYEQFSVREPHSTEILCKRISCIVAQTMVRQLVSVVKTSIWSVRWRTRQKTAFNGIGRLHVPVHAGRELVKRESLLFLLS